MSAGYSDANGIWQYGEDDNPDGTAAGLLNLGQASVSTVVAALSARQPYTWANSTDRTNQTGMTVGAKGTQTDTGATYRYTGSAWQIWEQALTSYTPTLTGFSGTSPTIVATYSVSNGRYLVDVAVTLASGTTVGSQPTATVPAAMAASPYIADYLVGRTAFAVAGNNYPAMTVRHTTTSIVTSYSETASGSFVGFGSVSSVAPATWTTNNVWRVHAEYFPA